MVFVCVFGGGGVWKRKWGTYAERAVASSAKPFRDAVEVEDVSTVPPRDAQTVLARRRGVGLVLDAGLVQAVAADGTRVRAD